MNIEIWSDGTQDMLSGGSFYLSSQTSPSIRSTLQHYELSDL